MAVTNRHRPSGDKRRRPFWRDPALLGKTYFDRQQEIILTIGKDVWTREEAVERLRLGNSAAAINLTRVATDLEVASLDQLISRYTMDDLFHRPGFGVVTAIVLMKAQADKGHDPVDLLDRNREADAPTVTLGTMKHRALQDQKQAATAANPPPSKTKRKSATTS